MVNAHVSGMTLAEQRKAQLEKKINITQIVIIISVTIGIVFFTLAFLTGIGAISTDPVAWLDYLVVGLLVLLGPYGFYMSGQYARIKDIERRLPEFLRDVAEAGRFGMTLADAIVVASSGRYGRLTPEIKRMAAQIKWGVPATEALKLFADRVKSPMVSRIVAIIIKSSEAGGNVADVLGMVSHATKEDLLTEEERKIAMSTYVAVVYIAFFVFLATIIILTATFLPKMEEAGSSISKSAEAGITTITLVHGEYVSQITLALVLAAIVHAVGDGIMAGVLENGRIPFGFRHSFILLIMGYVVLRLLLKKEYLLGAGGGA